MIAKICLHLCLSVLLFSEASSQNCASLRVQLSNTSKKNLALLKTKMRTNLPLKCLSDMRDFVLPQETFKKIPTSLEENPMVAAHEIFKQTIGIFNQNLTETAWDENSTAAFQMGLHQQIQHLQTCLSAETENGTASPRAQNIQLTRLRVKRYFQVISNFLKEKQHSLCAWEIAHQEIMHCLQSVEQLTNRTPN